MKKLVVLFLFIFSNIFSSQGSKEIRIMKIGGGLITDKLKPNTPKPKVIEAIASAIASFIKEKPNTNIILVTGAGSYAHPIAKKYKLHKGYDDSKSIGAIETHMGAKKLNEIFVKKLNEKNVKAIPLHPLNLVICESGKIIKFSVDPIMQALKRGFIPVLHGDMVFDEKNGMTILSGDKIVPFLAVKFGVHSVGLAGITDGVYNHKKETIPEINPENIEGFISMISKSTGIDVTGGMLGKVKSLLNEKAPPVSYIFNGANKKNIYAYLNGDAPKGTKINNQKKDKGDDSSVI
ncbi:isopentenyl phosphate kinase family protein [bacterium]|nr:isopentenyl phosphate kinase family protein [bacterium]